MGKKNLTIMVLCLSCIVQVAAQTKPIPVYLDDSQDIEIRINDALSRMTLEEKIAMIHAQSNFSTPGVPRLGIPEIMMTDGPHGVNKELEWNGWGSAGWTNDASTAFPAMTCLAATFNPDLALSYGKAIGEEARYRKKDMLLGPALNIYRTPANGRNFEYMGEDPFLISKIVPAYVKGVQENGVAACIKHFALNNQETWRGHIDVDVSDRALYEIYLPGFKAGVIEGKAWAVMGSYNKYKGQYCTHNKKLIMDILKGEWGFDGVLVSDWGSTHNTDEAAQNGLDIEMGTFTDGLTTGEKFSFDRYFLAQPYYKKILSGQLPMSSLDDKVKRILRLNYRTNMNRNRPFGKFVCDEHSAVAREIAEQGVVLLKNNNNFFPVIKGKFKKIVVIGENASRKLCTGGGSSNVKVSKEITPLEGLIEKYGKDVVFYTMGYGSGPTSYGMVSSSPYNADSLKREALALAKDADVILYFGGLNKNFNQDCESGDRLSYDLPFGQNELIEELLKVNKNTGIILISGNAVAMPWLNKVPALMQSWYLGSESGKAMANVISGEVNPSGRLPFSIPRRWEDNGAMSFGKISYPGDSIHEIYKEDIFVGYRWYDMKKKPALFPFGYGLSYTAFSVGKLSSDKKFYSSNDTINVYVNVSNIGHMDGAYVVQIYASQKNPSLPRPVKELKGFQKVFLKQGENRIVNIAIPVKDLAYYNDKLHKWIVDCDRFTLSCASSSASVLSSIFVNINNN